MTPELQELTRFCEITYGVPALQTRILVGALLPTRYPPLWLMISAEKNTFLTDFSYATRQIRAVDVWDTWEIRFERPRWANKTMMTRLATREEFPCYFADRFWQMPAPPVLRQSRYPYLAQECVRIRHDFNQAAYPEQEIQGPLHQRICAALSAAAVDRGGVVPMEPAQKWSEWFQRRLKLLPLIDKYYMSPTALARNLCYIAWNHAHLCGRWQLNDDDMQAVAIVIRSCVPAWMERLLSVLLCYNANAIGLKTLITETRLDDAWRNLGSRQNPMRLGEKLAVELWMSGILNKTSNGRYRIKEEHFNDIAAILNGKL